MKKDTLYQSVIDSVHADLALRDIIQVAHLIELRRIADLLEINYIERYGGSSARFKELKERQEVQDQHDYLEERQLGD